MDSLSRKLNNRKRDETSRGLTTNSTNQLVLSNPLDGNFATVALRSRGGLSMSARPDVWKVLIGYDTLEGIEMEERGQREKRYRELLYHNCWLDGDLNVMNDKSGVSNVIDLDVARTQVRVDFYSGGKDYSVPDASSSFSRSQEVLRRVLHTLCVEEENNRRVGSSSRGKQTQKKGPSMCYVQGMNEIAGLLLYAFCRGDVRRCTETVEADTFWCLYSLLLYVHPNEASKRVGQFSTLLRYFSPHLFDHLQSIDSIILQSCATRWMVALFTQDFPVNDSLRVWDFLLSFGTQIGEAMVYVAVAICLVKQNMLLASDHIEEIIPCLKSLEDGCLSCSVLEEATSLMTRFPFADFHRLVKKMN